MAIKKISSSEISVVVQGPVVDLSLTTAVLESVRTALPQAEIILSTWLGQSDGIRGVDRVIESVDPGGLQDLNGRTFNLKRQSVSTLAGLSAATRRFTLKMRVDTRMTSDALCIFDEAWTQEVKPLFHGRLVTPTVVVRDPMKFPQNFSMCDLVHFGLTSDLLGLWRSVNSAPMTMYWHDDAYRPGVIGNFVGYSRLRAAAEQICIVAPLSEVESHEQGWLTDPCDMRYDVFVKAREVMKKSFVVVDYMESGFIFPQRTWSPGFVRASFLKSGCFYLGDSSDRAAWTLALLNKNVFAFARFSYLAPLVSHILYRYLPSLGPRARKAFHALRGDRSSGSMGKS